MPELSEELLAGLFEQMLKVLAEESSLLPADRLPVLLTALPLDLSEHLAEVLSGSPLDLSGLLAEVLSAEEEDIGSGVRRDSHTHHGRSS